MLKCLLKIGLYYVADTEWLGVNFEQNEIENPNMRIFNSMKKLIIFLSLLVIAAISSNAQAKYNDNEAIKKIWRI